MRRTTAWKPKVDLPEGAMTWDSQVRQYPKIGPVGISYFAGDVSADYPGKPPIDCLLWRGPSGLLRGILNHYPTDYPPYERKGNVNVWVDPEGQRQGIATALWHEAVALYGADLTQQRFTKVGAAFASAIIQKEK